MCSEALSGTAVAAAPSTGRDGEHDTGETEVEKVCPQAGAEGGRRRGPLKYALRTGQGVPRIGWCM